MTLDKIAENLTTLEVEFEYISQSDMRDEALNIKSYLEDGNFNYVTSFVKDELKNNDNTQSQTHRLEKILNELEKREENAIFYKLGSLKNPLNYKTGEVGSEKNKLSFNDFFLHNYQGQSLTKNGYEVGDVTLKEINEGLEKSHLKQIYFYTGKNKEKEFVSSNRLFSDFAKLNEKEYNKQESEEP